MHSAAWDVAAVAHTKRFRRPAAGQRHFAVENNVRRQAGMGVIRVERPRTILPDIGVRESLGQQPFSQFAFVQRGHDLGDDYTAAFRLPEEGHLRAERVWGKSARKPCFVERINPETTGPARQEQEEAAEPVHP